MREGAGPDDLAAQFRRFATGVRRDGARRYARIAEGVAGDVSLLALVGAAPPDQRRPNILLAAVHYLLLSESDDPLAEHYPTVLAWRGGDPSAALDPDTADPFPPFAAFCARRRDEILKLVASRATQTNEVGRCRAILPALSTVGERAGVPLAVVDLGAAAGLNLLFDRYAYDYAYGNGDHVRAGAAGSPVGLDCAVREGAVPTAVPSIAARVGLDRRPVDVRDDDQLRWLLACQWPDHVDRFEIASRALELARSLPELPVVHEGGAVDDLERVAAPLAPDAHLCLLHSWVAAYFTPEEQRALSETVTRLAATRPVSWIIAEAPYEVPGLPMPPPAGPATAATPDTLDTPATPDTLDTPATADTLDTPGTPDTKAGGTGPERGATAVVLVEEGPGRERTAVRLGDMHSHGRWLHWYGAPS
jgi:hypothetical protein